MDRGDVEKGDIGKKPVAAQGLERWISLLRLVAIPFVVVAVAVASYPPGRWETWAWITTAAFVIGSVAFFVLARSALGQRYPFSQSVAAQVFDTVIVVAYVIVFAFERGLPVQQILYIDPRRGLRPLRRDAAA